MGEFVKRIADIVCSDLGWSIAETEIQLALRELIEEAKNDCPFYVSYFGFRFKKGKEKLDLENWFVKWFGKDG